MINKDKQMISYAAFCEYYKCTTSFPKGLGVNCRFSAKNI